MKSTPKLSQHEFDMLLSQYVQQMSKKHHLRKEIENKLLRQISKRLTP
jgi:response regulator of citrate/malate metabolism